MSIEAMKWALQQPLHGCRKFVLLMLAYHADNDGKCWPGLELIAKECGISRASVINHINEISTLGLIEKQKRHDARGYRRSTLYLLHLNQSLETQPRKIQRKEILRRDFENQSPTFAESNVQNLDGNIIEQSLEQTIEHTNIGKVETSPRITSTNNEVQEVFKYWQKILNHPKAKLDDKRRRTIERASKQGYTIDQLKQVVDGCSLSPYHMGVNPEKKHYDSIDLLFRNADKIEQFIAYATNPPTANLKLHLTTIDPMSGAGYE